MSMSNKGITRVERAVLAVYDYTTRDGATNVSVLKDLKKDGFTLEEINSAIDAIRGVNPLVKSTNKGFSTTIG